MYSVTYVTPVLVALLVCLNKSIRLKIQDIILAEKGACSCVDGVARFTKVFRLMEEPFCIENRLVQVCFKGLSQYHRA